MNENIQQANPSYAAPIAALVSDSNKDVAIRFNLTDKNSPKHPSFCSVDWVKEDFERGVVYFIFKLKDKPVGCVAFETPDPDTAYLNRLSVIPSARNTGIGNKLVLHHLNYSKKRAISSNTGIGNKLVLHHLNYSKKRAISKVSIGIIAQHTELKNWYKQIGFQEGETKQFEHLPFEVCYMSYIIK